MKVFITLIVLLFTISLAGQTISIIGTATPSGDWTTDHNLTETSPGSGIWTDTLALSANEVKFRQDGSWDPANNWGGASFPAGALIPDGPNIAVNQGGVYEITFDLQGMAYTFDFISASGYVGIGTSTPEANLHVEGSFKLSDGSQGPGKILTSSATGLASWTDPSTAVPDTLPSPSMPVPIAFQGDTLWVHPTDNAVSVDWTTALATCNDLDAFSKDDWYVPSRTELDAIYKQSFLLTGLEQYNEWKYWSSTEKDVDNAYSQRMDYGGPDPDPKTEAASHRVRCVRQN